MLTVFSYSALKLLVDLAIIVKTKLIKSNTSLIMLFDAAHCAEEVAPRKFYQLHSIQLAVVAAHKGLGGTARNAQGMCALVFVLLLRLQQNTCPVVSVQVD
jgi:hypothetical protein